MARYLRKTKSLFIHIPKTGGTWIEHILEATLLKNGLWLGKAPRRFTAKHYLYQHIRRKHFPAIENTFCFVRHPLNYYESTWLYLQRKGKKTRNRLHKKFQWTAHRHSSMYWHEDFNEWCRRLLAAEPLWYTRLIEHYVGPENGEFIDYIGRTERLRDDFVEILRLLGYEEEVDEHLDVIQNYSKVNARKADQKIEWDEAVKAMVLDQERLMINRFYSDENYERLYYGLDKEADS